MHWGRIMHGIWNIWFWFKMIQISWYTIILLRKYTVYSCMVSEIINPDLWEIIYSSLSAMLGGQQQTVSGAVMIVGHTLPPIPMKIAWKIFLDLNILLLQSLGAPEKCISMSQQWVMRFNSHMSIAAATKSPRPAAWSSREQQAALSKIQYISIHNHMLEL